MKRKFADRPDWTRVLEKRFKFIHAENDELDGYLAITYIDKVQDPLFVGIENKDLCLADNGYTWVQYFPERYNYSLTAMFNKEQDLIQLYYDVCNGNFISSSGMPYYDDLYLDVVLLSTGDVLLFDEDELEQALLDRDISKEQYDLAWDEAKRLIKHVDSNKNKLLRLSKKYLEYMISLE